MKKSIHYTLSFFIILCCINFSTIVAQSPYNEIPNVHLKKHNGDVVNVADYGNNGKLTIFKFWTGKVIDCSNDLKKTAQMCEEWKGELDVEIVAVNLDRIPQQVNIQPHLDNYSMKFDNLIDSEDILLGLLSYRANVIPYTIVTDHKGRIVGEYAGNSSANIEVLEKAVKEARSKLPIVSFEELRRRREQHEKEFRAEEARRRAVAAANLPDIEEDNNILLTATADESGMSEELLMTETTIIEETIVTEEVIEETVVTTVTEETIEDKSHLPRSLRDVNFIEGRPSKLGDRTVKRPKKMTLHGQDIAIHLWDTEIEDGDIVSLYFNGKWILTEHKLWHEVEIVNIKLEADKENELIVYAHNEGKRPPNTVAMIIFDKKGKRNVTLNSDMTSSAAIKFDFKE